MGKGAQKQTMTSSLVGEAASKSVLIEGELYEVSEFKHPGGSIIKQFVGHGDATEAFREFHGRSTKAAKMLKALPHQPASSSSLPKERLRNGREALSEDFAALRRDLDAEGFFAPHAGEVAYRLGEIVLMHALGVWLLCNEATSWKVASFCAGVAVLGCVSGRCGWVMHEAGHYSLTGSIRCDRVLQNLLYGVGCGMSAAWWRNQHNKHHATPQKLKHDVDLDTLPLVAFNAAVADKARSPVVKLWLKFQAVLFVPVSCLLVALGWQFFLHPRHSLRTKKYGELLSYALRYALIFGVVLRGYSPPAALATYLLYDQLAASYIFTNFALSHTHLPVTNPDDYLHWVEYAADHTTNLQPGPLCNWWMANLNFQIEHHLFPSMPQFRHKLIAPRVKALFHKHGLTYDVRPYFSCLYQTLSNLHAVGNHHPAGAKTD